MKCLYFLTIFLIASVTCQEEKYLVTNAKIKFTTVQNVFVVKSVKNLKNFDSSIVNGSQLKIISGSVPVLYEGSFRDMGNLRMLQLPSLGINSIEPYAFKNLPNFDRIQLQDNNISDILNDVFNFLPISQLFLHRNKIKFIESGAFDNMPNLHTIKLNNNDIKEWDASWFSNTPKLTEVYFRRNHIAYLQQNAFRNIRKLQVGHHDENSTNIYLSRNKITTIHQSALSGLVRLNNFYLDRNKLTEIPDTLFFKIESIYFLNLKRNKIKNLSPNMFSTTTSLDILDLSRNSLDCIPVEIATKAKEVSLNDNHINCNCSNHLMEAIKKKGTKNALKLDDCKKGWRDEKDDDDVVEEGMEDDEENFDEEFEEEEE